MRLLPLDMARPFRLTIPGVRAVPCCFPVFVSGQPSTVMKIEDRGWRMAKRPTSLAPSPLAAEDYRSPKAGACPLIPRFREASWSAVAERSGDTAFAPPMPLRQRPSRRNPNQLNPAFNVTTIQRFNDSGIARVSPKSSVPVSGPRSPVSGTVLHLARSEKSNKVIQGSLDWRRVRGVR
jgi:hypothetical protein